MVLLPTPTVILVLIGLPETWLQDYKKNCSDTEITFKNNCMHKIIFPFLFIFLTGHVQSQNVGVGTNSPTYPLTVVSNNNGIGVVQKNGVVEMGLELTSGGWLKTFSNHNLHFATNNSSVPAMTISTSGNVGIGLAGAVPSYKLDIEGRLRFQHSTNSAGIWFDGTAFTPRSFIGTLNDDYVGIYGNGGAGWNFVMNVENGNTGIGTSSPTAKLDVNGTLRIRGADAKLGSTFVSTDANGNAEWMAPVAFRAQGSVDGGSTTVGAGAWTKVFFSTTTSYNAGLHYQPLASQFVAPVKGIYHFNAQTSWLNRRYSVGIGLEGTRNGVSITTLPQYSYANGRVEHEGSYYTLYKANIESLSVDVKLEAGDIIWLKVYRNTGDQLSADPTVTWFTGRLITPY
ncbi:MAG: hypothetical protein E6H07_07535 [Bacteroidetes bacterium]|nr:MAG: hypothetical protein E6H07_07535 [Bacteroidota bacterium]